MILGLWVMVGSKHPDLTVFMVLAPPLTLLRIGFLSKSFMQLPGDPILLFASFYLKDMSQQWEDCRSLGPFVASDQVLDLSDPV